MAWSCPRTARSRPEVVCNAALLRASTAACEALETRCLLAAGLRFAPAPAYTETGGIASSWFPAVGRFNNDSYPDLFVAVTPTPSGTSFPNGTISVLLGNGSGGFSLSHTIDLNFRATYQMAVADFNNDGYSDVVIKPDQQYVASQKSLFIVLGRADGKLTAPAELVLPTPTAFPGITDFVPAEVNGSGNKLDLIV